MTLCQNITNPYLEVTFVHNKSALEYDDVKITFMSVLDLVMIAPIQLQCIVSYFILVSTEVEPHAPNTY